MTQKNKKNFYNFNLFLIMVLIGLFMYWKKQSELSNPNIEQQYTSIVNTPQAGNQVSKDLFKE